jgi:hypothetical protein
MIAKLPSDIGGIMKIICNKCKGENIEEKIVLNFKFHQCKDCGHQQEYIDLSALIKVGECEKKAVTRLNNQLYLKAKEIMTANENMGVGHIGLQGISAFVDWLEDWLEENYKLEAR